MDCPLQSRGDQSRERRAHFVLLMALWSKDGKVKNNDVRAVLQLKSVAAADALTVAQARYPSLLARYPKHVELIGNRSEDYPLFTQAPYLFEQHRGMGLPRELSGVDMSQVLSNHSLVTEGLPDRDTLNCLLRAALHQTVVRFSYVGLRRGESRRKRIGIPVNFELIDGHWRVKIIEHDAAAHTHVAKWFLLARVLDALPGRSPEFKNMRMFEDNSSQPVKVQLTLSEDLTFDQTLVVRRQLGADDNNQITLRRGDVFDFKRRYMESHIEPNPNIIWPLVKDLKVL